MKRHIFEVGDKVRVPKWMAVGNRCRGIVTHRDGANLLVRLNHCGIMCHLYVTEVTFGWYK